MGKAFYVYLLIDPRDNKPFYVGKGKGERLMHHEAEARLGKQSPKCHRIRTITDAGLTVRRQFDSEHTTAELACQRETELIKRLPGLLNITHNNEKPELIYFTDAMFAFAFAQTTIDKAKAAYRWIANFHYDRMSSDFERRVWMRARDCVMANAEDLQQLDAQGQL